MLREQGENTFAFLNGALIMLHLKIWAFQKNFCIQDIEPILLGVEVPLLLMKDSAEHLLKF